MKTYEVLIGTHTDVAGNVYKKGDKIKSAADLTNLFPNKFTEVIAQEPAPASEKVESEKKETPRKNVTSKFKVAGENNLLVFKKGNEFEIEDENDPQAGVLNENSITKKDDVKAFIADYIEDDSSDSDSEE